MTSPRPTALVTGATSGLGRAVAAALAERGLRVLAHGRDPRLLESVVAELTAKGHQVEGHLADFASLAEVRSLADRVRASGGAPSILVNNAAAGAGPPPHSTRETSADGHELRFAVNYLAPVLLTRSLLPPPGEEGGARVVNVGSIGQAPPDFDDLEFERDYNGGEAYFRSKFALAAFTVDLAEERPGIAVNCLHPATFMDTKQVREAGVEPRVPVSDGVPPVLNLATGDGGRRHTGVYFNGMRPARAHPDVYVPAVRARLRAATDELLSPFTQEAAR